MATPEKNNHIDYIEFPAPSEESLRATKQFYGTVFGWEYKDWAPSYSDTSGSGLASGINSDPGQRPPAPMVVLYSAALEETRDKVKAAGGKIVKDIFPFPGGRRFEYQDPAGNQLGVWSDK